MLVQQVTADQIVHRVAVLVNEKLMNIDERMKRIEILLAGADLKIDPRVSFELRREAEFVKDTIRADIEVLIEDLSVKKK